MWVLTKDEFLIEKRKLIPLVRDGAVFIHPTDTIYGIGCNVLNAKAVSDVRDIKKRSFMPFSILVPSKNWIRENCVVNPKAEQWIEKLPGPYTLVLSLKNKAAIVPGVNSGMNTIGVRIPDHWFSEFVSELKFPIITTSANIRGEEFMTSIEDLDSRIKSKMDFIVYEGPKKGRPSTVVDLTKKETKLLKR